MSATPGSQCGTYTAPPPNSARSQGQLVALKCLSSGTSSIEAAVTSSQYQRCARVGPGTIGRAASQACNASAHAASQRPPSCSSPRVHQASRSAKPWGPP